jgi:hypothetical protein
MPAPRKGRRLGYVLYALSQGFSERPWFDALSISGPDMCDHPLPGDADIPGLPPSSLDYRTWCQVGSALKLCERHTLIVDLILRDASDEKIAETLGIAISTTKTLLRRVRDRTLAPTRIRLAARVVATVAELRNNDACPPGA